nr:hypothetical protein [Acaryochloris sp. CCMEE 5410]
MTPTSTSPAPAALQSSASADSKPTLVLVDGHSLAFRAYYAFAKGREGGLRTSTGIPTSVCYGFLKNLLDLLKTENPII